MADSPAATSAAHRHPAPVVLLHWLSAGLVALAFAAGLAHGAIDDEATGAIVLLLHRQAGLTLLALLVLRLATRLAHRGRGPVHRATPVMLRVAAGASHTLLYLARIALPVLGWALSDARAQHPAWLGVLPLPHLAAVDPDRADTLEDLHRWAAWSLAALVALHFAAALWHHWVRRDGVLRSMWPRRQPAALATPLVASKAEA